ncbi:hypothetical protein ACI513_19695 [Chryseobacterium sp. M5]|uniref:hypothetical protein n=1 Tax=Chryseobacterium sp. M5 TaxID=3379128 RepID=UPI00385743B2
MVVFWTIIFYLNIILSVFSLLYICYEKIKKKNGFLGFFLMSLSLFIMFFSQDRLCNSILNEIISDLKSGRLVLEKSSILTNQNIYNLQIASRKHNYSEKTFAVTVLPSKDDLIIKKDFLNDKYWVFYSKYYYSRSHTIGFVE